MNESQEARPDTLQKLPDAVSEPPRPNTATEQPETLNVRCKCETPPLKAVLEIVAAVAVILYTTAAYLQWKAMKGQLKAIQGQLAGQQQQLNEDERFRVAYLTIEDFTSKDFPVKALGGFKVVNRGNSLATNIRVVHSVFGTHPLESSGIIQNRSGRFDRPLS